MNIQVLLLIFLFSISFGKKPNDIVTITFSKDGIDVSGEGAVVSGTTVTIEKSGSYLAEGESEEANIIVDASSVTLYLQHLDLTSSVTAPLTVNSKLDDINIINIENTTLKDFEDVEITEGECAVIKIKKKSVVSFENQATFTLEGICKNVIKGNSETSIVFVSSKGEYKINANKTGISSDGSLEFNQGTYTINSTYGDAIKSTPDDTDTDSLGKILVNSGTFNIECHNDAFTASNNITIVDGTFNIKTENGYNSTTFDKETESAKGFKVKNNVTGCEIYMYNGSFSLNTADDAIHSGGNLTIRRGKYVIYAGDDGLHATFKVILGLKDAPVEDLDLQVLASYEGIEGMSITIHSGRIVSTAKDDGINACGGDSPRPGPPPRGSWGRTNKNLRDREDERRPWDMNNRGFRPRRGEEGSFNPPPPPPGPRGNDSYYISIHGGDISVFCDGDGIDSNGNIFIHAGDIKVFSQGNRDNEPIDHDGNFTLFIGEVLGVGSKGMEYVHEGIKKGNMTYAYYAGDISKDKTLTIKNENGEVVKEGKITKNINYIFYTSLVLNEDYSFYITDSDGNVEEYTFTFGLPPAGEDDEDTHDDEL